MLGADGHRVLSAADGTAAWDLLLDNMDGIDVLVTDHRMPGHTGLELLEMLRQTTFKGRVYVYTSNLDGKEQQRYRDLRVNGIFMKNSPLESVVQAVGTRPSSGAGR